MSALPSHDAGAPLPALDYERFADFMRRIADIDLHQYKRRQMERRIRSFAQRVGCDTLDDYQRVVQADPQELDALLDRITINVSQLFRNPEQWERLAKDIVPELAARGSIRAWSAGCSFGAEAYSLAATVRETAPGTRLNIHASDIDRRILAAAGRGEFTAEDARTADPAVLARQFEQTDHGGWRASRPLLDAVDFAREDLLTITPPPGSYDLVLCRNVVIYFTPEARSAVHEMLARSLRPGGYLMIGSTERIAQPLADLGLEPAGPFVFRRTQEGNA
ncbi:MAG: protein-glutamate O-methyltransferase CheR [Thermoleophilia bacterium]|nr:protein-glutamate O-methyltransferase CheR [Thermoleophilia bacterium]